MTSWACLVRSVLKYIFHLKTHSDIFWISELRLLAKEIISWIIQKIDVSLAKSFLFETIASRRSLIYIKKTRGTRIKPCGIPVLILAHSDNWPLRTLWDLLLMKLSIRLKRSPEFFFNWDSLHARLNSHYEACSYKKEKHKKDYSIQEICLERTYC